MYSLKTEKRSGQMGSHNLRDTSIWLTLGTGRKNGHFIKCVLRLYGRPFFQNLYHIHEWYPSVRAFMMRLLSFCYALPKVLLKCKLFTL